MDFLEATCVTQTVFRPHSRIKKTTKKYIYRGNPSLDLADAAGWTKFLDEQIFFLDGRRKQKRRFVCIGIPG